MKYAQYEKGEHIYAWTYRIGKSDCWLSISGRVINDNGGRELEIEPDKDSNFYGEIPFIVYKDRIF